MRVAVMVISLGLMVVVFVQSCTVAAGGSLADDESVSGAGAAGILVALLFLLGGAFALGMPNVSAWMFWLAALVAILAGLTTDFGDLVVWGIVAIVLGVMSSRSAHAVHEGPAHEGAAEGGSTDQR